MYGVTEEIERHCNRIIEDVREVGGELGSWERKK